MESAVIIRVALPDALDRLRRRCVADASLGVPGHVTLLYPFVEPPGLRDDTRDTVASIASAHASFSFVLSGPEQWPDTLYAAVDPNEPFVAIHRDLASAFPGYLIYGRPGLEFVPHVTIAEGDHVGDPSVLGDPAWSELPVTALANALEVIAEDRNRRWRRVWTVPLAASDL